MYLEEQETQNELELSFEEKLTNLSNFITKVSYGVTIVFTILICTLYIVEAGSLENYLNLGWKHILEDLFGIFIVDLIILINAPEGLPLIIAAYISKKNGKK